MSITSLTVADFRAANIENVLDALSTRLHTRYSRTFWEASNSAQESGNLTLQRIYQCLALWTNPEPQFDSHKKPYSDAFLQSISEEEYLILRELAVEITDPELKARLADLAWLGKVRNKREPELAKLAITSYLEASEIFTDQGDWSYRSNRIERALRIAIALNSQEEEAERVWQHIETILAEMDGKDEWFLSERLMRLMQQEGRGDAETYAPMARKCAEKAASQHGIGQWSKARRYYYLEANWYEQGNPERNLALEKAAETYVAEADEELLVFNNPIGASMHVQRAIQAFRDTSGATHRERIDELQRRLVLVNKQAQDSFESFRHPLNTQEYQEQAVSLLQGKSFEESLNALVLMFAPPSMDQLRKLVESSTDEFVEMTAEKQIVNANGQVIARMPSLLSADPIQKEKAIQFHMYETAGHFHLIHVHGFVLPSIQYIQREHPVRLQDWIEVLRHSPFVPTDRLGIYARGFQAGLEGDWLISTHLLVPQIENSIRYILGQNNIIASTLKPDGIQAEQGLDITLKKPELASLISEEIILDLRALLIEQTGSYLRHKICHGLGTHNEFYSVDSVYLWWTALMLCILPILNVKAAEGVQASGSTQPSDSDASIAEEEGE